jgi:glycosyltransferase involved in cell wall biosynthesis
MKISIIIPTLNEENYLPLLLNSIKKQSFKDFEVIVADAQSSDNTVGIAAQFGAIVVDGGMPAKGRNNGAHVAKGDFFFFLDADVILPDEFLQKVLDEMQERYLDLSTCEVIPLSDLQIDRVLHNLANLSIRIGQFTNPHAAGFCILSTKRLYERVGGFDESLTMAEDHDFIKRATRFRPLRVLDSTQISVSVRRLEKEGRALLINKYVQVELHRILNGELKTKVVEYEFGNFQSQVTDKKPKRLSDIETKLIRLDKILRNFREKLKPNEQINDFIPPKELIKNLRKQIKNVKIMLKGLFEK